MKKAVAVLIVILLLLTLAPRSKPANPLQTIDLYGTWYCEEANACIIVDEVETQLYDLDNPRPCEGSEPELNGITVVWQERIGTYTYSSKEGTEKLICSSSELLPIGSVFVKDEPIVELEDLYNIEYYAKDYKIIALGERRSAIELIPGEVKMDYPRDYGRFIIGNILYLYGERFYVHPLDDSNFELEHIVDPSGETGEIYSSKLNVSWTEYNERDFVGEWLCQENGSRLCMYADSYKIITAAGDEILGGDWYVEYDVVAVDNAVVFRIQKVGNKLQLIEEGTANVYVRVKPQSGWL